MQIKILFDKNSKNLCSGWGVSFLIDNKVLFDTGEKGEWLLKNMEALKVDINKIEAVVISHDHWDHWGGLWDLLQKKKGMLVYICPRFSRKFKDSADKLGARIIEVEKFTQILPDIFSTGEIAGTYQGNYMPEQALVLKTSHGITIITGCAHPGILKIVEETKTKFPDEPIYFVLGGFHLMESDKRKIEIIVKTFKEMKIERVGPTHCSGPEAEALFKKEYGNNFMHVIVGETLEI